MREGAELFAESIGTNESVKQTIRVEDGEELAQGSQRTVEELTAHSNIIKNLGKGQCILLRHYPTRLDLLNVKYIDPEILEDNVRFLTKEGLLKIRPTKQKQISSQAEETPQEGYDFLHYKGGKIGN